MRASTAWKSIPPTAICSTQFLSPLTNKRTDEYGGDIAGRIRIHLEIIKAVRGAVGQEFPILLRMGAADYMEGGLTIEDSKAAAQAFESAGIDMLDISGGMCRYTIPGGGGPGYFYRFPRRLKKWCPFRSLLPEGSPKQIR